MLQHLKIIWILIILPDGAWAPFRGNATFTMGGLFKFYHTIRDGRTKTLKSNVQAGIMFSEAMRFAVEKINNDSGLLYGFQIKEKLVDVKNIKALVEDEILWGYIGGTMPCAIGPMLSTNAYELAILSNAISYPLISYYASFDRIMSSQESSFFYRSVPIDAFRTLAMLDVIKALEWNYVAIISSFDVNGETMARQFVGELSKISISVSKHQPLKDRPEESDYDKAVKRVSKDIKVKGLILFTTNEDSSGVLRALNRTNTTKFQILAANGFSNYIEVISGNEEIAEGAISVEYGTQEIPEFRDYFLQLNPTVGGSRHFKDFWKATFNCKLDTSSSSSISNCTGKEKLQPGRGYYSNTPVQLVINAVYSMAHALRHIIEELCKDTDGFCEINPKLNHLYVHDMQAYLNNKTFQDLTLNVTNPFTGKSSSLVEYDILNYVKVGDDYKNIKIGHWSVERGDSSSGLEYLQHKTKSRFKFNLTQTKFKGSFGPISSVCSDPCKLGEIKTPSAIHQLPSCWICEKCKLNDIVLNNSCSSCKEDEKPDSKYDNCIALPIKYLNMKNNIAMPVLFTMAMLGITLTGITTGIFLKNNNSRIVRAAGRDLCYFMLVGIGLVFLTPVLFISEPNWLICSLRSIFPGLAFVMCYAPLFLKTNRIYRIFHNAMTSGNRPPLVSPQSQVLILSSIIGMQTLLGIIWGFSTFSSTQSDIEKYFPDNREFVMYHCGNHPSPLLINLIVSVLFMIACTWFAFKTRNFPKNYNEAKYIGFTMYVTCICWAVFLPSHFIIKESPSFTRPLSMLTVFLLIGYITLIGLFGIKIRMLLFPGSMNYNLSETSSFTAASSKFPLKRTKLGSTASQDENTTKCSQSDDF